MKAQSKVIMGLIMSIVLLLMALPLLGVCAEPKPEGTLNVAVASISQEGFLADLGDIDQGVAWVLVYDYPLYSNQKGDILPGLAERYEYSKDGLTLTLFLRKGVPWQEGWGEVTADDFKYTYDRLGRSLSSVLASPLRASVKSIEVVNRYTVAFHLKQPAPELWGNLFGWVTSSGPIMCKKYIEAVGDDKAKSKPIGSGPYRLVEHKPGNYMKFEASDKHWRVVPEFKYLFLRIVPEESTRAAMLKTGEIDIAPISVQSIGDLRNHPEITVKERSGGYMLFACFGGMFTPADNRFKEGVHRKDPWADRRVREAMSMAIDRQAIVKSVYKGAAKPMPICWTLEGYEKLKPIPYDPGKAKRLLAEAGYPKGFSMKVAAVSIWDAALEMGQVMEIIATYFQDIGLKVQIVPMDKLELLAMSRSGKSNGFVFPFHEGYKFSYSGYHYQRFAPGGTSPCFQSDELTALINKYETELNLQKRADSLGKVRDYHYNESVTIPLVLASPLWAWRHKQVREWPETPVPRNHYLEYVRHAQPLNTWRAYTP